MIVSGTVLLLDLIIITHRFPRCLGKEPKNCFPWDLKS